MQVSLEKKILSGFLINIIIVLAFGWISLRRVQNGNEEEGLVNHRYEVNDYTEKILSIINSIDNNSKGYVVTGNEKYLEKSIEITYSIEGYLEQLTNLLEANPQLAKKSIELTKLINEKIINNNQFIELRKYKNLGAAQSFFVVEKDIRLNDKILQCISQIRLKENENFNRIKTREELLEATLKIIYTALFLCTLLLLVIVYLIIKYQLKAKRAVEESLEKNKKLLQAILSNSQNLFFIKNPSGQYLLINKRFELLFQQKNELIIGKTDQYIFPKEIANKLQSSDKEVVKAGKEMEFEEIFPQQDGPHNYIVLKFPLLDHEGKIYAIGSIATDITQRKKLEFELRENQKQIQTILDGAPEAVIVVNEEGKIIKWNQKAEIIFGWKDHEVLGKKMSEFIIPDRFRELYLRSIDLFMETGKGPLSGKTIEITALNKKNEEFDIELNISPSFIRGKNIFIAFARNITARKRMEKERMEAEKEVRENEQRMKLILDNIGEGVVVSDTNQNILLANPTAGEIIGIKEDNNTFSIEMDWSKHFELFYPDEKTTFPAQNLPLEKAIKGEFSDDIEIIILNNKTMEKKRIQVTGRPIKDENNTIIAAVATIRDITKYKELEDALKESEGKYRSLIGFKMKQ